MEEGLHLTAGGYVYTFDEELTTDQKLTHLNAMILTCDEAIAAAALDGFRPSYPDYVANTMRLESLRLWRELVQMEDELAASKADAEDPDPVGDAIQKAWCRRRRLDSASPVCVSGSAPRS